MNQSRQTLLKRSDLRIQRKDCNKTIAEIDDSTNSAKKAYKGYPMDKKKPMSKPLVNENKKAKSSYCPPVALNKKL